MKEWRKSRRLSQEGAARIAGFAQSTWDRYERSGRVPGGRNLQLLAQRCGIDPSLFMQEISEPAGAASGGISAVAGAQPVNSSLVETPAGGSSRAPAAFSAG